MGLRPRLILIVFIDICPTKAIIKPYRLDARRCIYYPTIEYKGSIPESLRPLIGNRVYVMVKPLDSI